MKLSEILKKAKKDDDKKKTNKERIKDLEPTRRAPSSSPRS